MSNNQPKDNLENELTEQIQPTEDLEQPKNTKSNLRVKKKQRTPAQIEATNKMIEGRRKRAQKQKMAKQNKKIPQPDIIESSDESGDDTPPPPAPKIKKPKKKIIYEDETSESEDEPEIVYVKKRKPKKTKKPKKKIIYEDETSESEEEIRIPKKQNKQKNNIDYNFNIPSYLKYV